MKCPLDQTTLVMTERQGIEIDYCPTCRGVWLDRGELDKLIASGEKNQTTHQQRPVYSDDDHYKYKKKHKRESFLGDLFDF
jgi:Zn-finger nucleic acid-binding protein